MARGSAAWWHLKLVAWLCILGRGCRLLFCWGNWRIVVMNSDEPVINVQSVGHGMQCSYSRSFWIDKLVVAGFIRILINPDSPLAFIKPSFVHYWFNDRILSKGRWEPSWSWHGVMVASILWPSGVIMLLSMSYQEINVLSLEFEVFHRTMTFFVENLAPRHYNQHLSHIAETACEVTLYTAP